MTTVDEGLHSIGHVVAELHDERGVLLAREEQDNLVTQVGDQVFAERGAGIGALAAPTGMRIGTGATAAAKTGAGAAIVTKVTAGNHAFDATFPQSALNGAARRITWKCTYAAGEGTSASNIAEAVLVNDTIASDVATAAANTVARVVFTTLGAKGATDTLTISWTFDLQGT